MVTDRGEVKSMNGDCPLDLVKEIEVDSHGVQGAFCPSWTAAMEHVRPRWVTG
jgi:hypothetical protein